MLNKTVIFLFSIFSFSKLHALETEALLNKSPQLSTERPFPAFVEIDNQPNTFNVTANMMVTDIRAVMTMTPIDEKFLSESSSLAGLSLQNPPVIQPQYSHKLDYDIGGFLVTTANYFWKRSILGSGVTPMMVYWSPTAFRFSQAQVWEDFTKLQGAFANLIDRTYPVGQALFERFKTANTSQLQLFSDNLGENSLAYKTLRQLIPSKLLTNHVVKLVGNIDQLKFIEGTPVSDPASLVSFSLSGIPQERLDKVKGLFLRLKFLPEKSNSNLANVLNATPPKVIGSDFSTTLITPLWIEKVLAGETAPLIIPSVPMPLQVQLKFLSTDSEVEAIVSTANKPSDAL